MPDPTPEPSAALRAVVKYGDDPEAEAADMALTHIARLEGALKDIASTDRTFVEHNGGYEAAIERIIDRARTALSDEPEEGRDE